MVIGDHNGGHRRSLTAHSGRFNHAS
jgi:hypothetical protein